jgi:hypothetical protein
MYRRERARLWSRVVAPVLVLLLSCRTKDSGESSLAGIETGACAGVSASDGLEFPAKSQVARAAQVARWRVVGVPANGGISFSYIVTGLAETRVPMVLGTGILDAATLATLGPQPTREQVATLVPALQFAWGARDANTPSDAALGRALSEDMPYLTCLEQLGATAQQAVQTKPLPLTASSPGGAASCRAQEIGLLNVGALTLARLTAALAKQDLGGVAQAAATFADANRDLNCCRGLDSPVVSRGEQCSCAARFPDRPVLREIPASDPVDNQYLCEACPASSPKWNGHSCEVCPPGDAACSTNKCPMSAPQWDGTSCKPCPKGEAWSIARQLCSRNGADLNWTKFLPNKTGRGGNPACFYNVTFSATGYYDIFGNVSTFTLLGGAQFNDKKWYPNFTAPPNARGPIHGIGLQTIEASTDLDPSCKADVYNPPLVFVPVHYATIIDGESGSPAARPLWGGTQEWGYSTWGQLSNAQSVGPWCCRYLYNNSCALSRRAESQTFDIQLLDVQIDPAFSAGVANCDRDYPPGPYTPPPVETPRGPSECPNGALLNDGSCEGGGPCAAPLVPDKDGSCMCPADGPPVLLGDDGKPVSPAQCGCSEGRRWNATKKACEHDAKCFGAVGDNCTPLQSDPKLKRVLGAPACGAAARGPQSACLSDPLYDPVAALQYQSISVGSLLHDDCCRRHPNGLFCGGDSSEPAACASEFLRGTQETLVPGAVWRKLFDPNVAMNDAAICADDACGTLTPYAGQLLAPAGSVMASDDARFCQSGSVTRLPSGETLCSGGYQTSRPTERVVAANPPAEAPTGGDCERFTGTAEEMRYWVTAGTSLAKGSFLSLARGMSAADMRAYYESVVQISRSRANSPTQLWVWRDAHRMIQSAAVLTADPAEGSATLESLTATRDGAASPLFRCLVDSFTVKGAGTLIVVATPQAPGFWAAEAVRVNRDETYPVFAARRPTAQGADDEWYFVSNETEVNPGVGPKFDTVISGKPAENDRPFFTPLGTNFEAGQSRKIIAAHGRGLSTAFKVPSGITLIDLTPRNYVIIGNVVRNVSLGYNVASLPARVYSPGDIVSDRALAPLESEKRWVPQPDPTGTRTVSKAEDIYFVASATTLSAVVTQLSAQGRTGTYYVGSCNNLESRPAGVVMWGSFFEPYDTLGSVRTCDDAVLAAASREAQAACGSNMFDGHLECLDAFETTLCRVTGGAASTRRQQGEDCRATLVSERDMCWGGVANAWRDTAIRASGRFSDDCARCSSR